MAPLKNLVISAAGDVGPRKGTDQLKKWVENNGGRWTPRVGEGVTHLICSKDTYKKNSGPVQQAKKLGAFIVSFDWLEDSLQRRRRLAERKYTWEVQRTQRRNAKQMKRLGPQADAKKFNMGCDLAMKDIGSGTSSKPSSRSSGFFASALDDLRKKREAREAEKDKQRGVTNALGLEERVADVADQDSILSPQTAKRRPASRPTPSVAKSPPQQETQNEEESLSMEPADGTSPLSLATDSAPTPSIFPPCLNYTLPSSSSHTPPPPPRTLFTPSTSTPAPSKPAEAKLTDLYHIYLDPTGFEYKLLLLRSNPHLNTFARYDLRLYESHTKPHPQICTPSYLTLLPLLQPLPRHTEKKNKATRPTLKPPKKPSASAPSSHRPRPQNANPTRRPSPHPTPLRPSFRAFRHAFRDLTLLSWHERLDAPLQRLRAQAFAIEPFIWRRPAAGLPTGAMPTLAVGASVDAAEAYARNAWGLPGLDEVLGEGGIGSALVREADDARRRAEENRVKEEAAFKAQLGIGSKPRRFNYNRPLFNTASGPPPPREALSPYEKPRTQDAVPKRLSGAVDRSGNGNARPGATVGGQKAGRAIFIDYRTAAQKRAGNGPRFEY
ncbi:hypothetical protein N0V90_001094 [Kalmusia sp. IMI 367209]|nr:hypothetical protein N0V90_001094 [Kalmusia sp. IMI 367209]